jgi:hypothetical protein
LPLSDFPDDSKRPKVQGTINRAAVQFLVNLGASVSVVSEPKQLDPFSILLLVKNYLPRNLYQKL